MKLLRNQEVTLALLPQLAITLAAVLTAWHWEPRFGYLMLATCLFFLLIHWISVHSRYRKIRALAADVNKILHGCETLSLENYAEGELAILQSEIAKMTNRLREQQLQLVAEKKHLADSMADISHQIRTPLTAINLLVQFLSEPELEPERRVQLSRELYDLLARIDWLITALLKISRLDAGTVQFKQEQLSLKQLMDTACAPLLVPMEVRGLTLEISAEGNFEGDPGWTSEAIGNIVKNCMEHTLSGGKITIDADENVLYSRIVISDTGRGIDEEDLPHIFERFYKGKNSDDKSFGIGLALSRMIIHSQNGTIEAKNTGSGASFTIYFYKGSI